jgi:hypothetical protein
MVGRRCNFNTTLNDPKLVDQNVSFENYDLVLIGFRISVMDGFDLYNHLHNLSKKRYNSKIHHYLTIFRYVL